MAASASGSTIAGGLQTSGLILPVCDGFLEGFPKLPHVHVDHRTCTAVARDIASALSRIAAEIEAARSAQYPPMETPDLARNARRTRGGAARLPLDRFLAGYPCASAAVGARRD